MTDLTTVAYRPLGPGSAVADGSVRPFYIEERKLRVTVACVGERLYAFEDLCPCGPERCPLSGGLLTGTTIMCQCHGSRFDIANGEVIAGPATQKLRTYEVREVDGTVEVRV